VNCKAFSWTLCKWQTPSSLTRRKALTVKEIKANSFKRLINNWELCKCSRNRAIEVGSLIKLKAPRNKINTNRKELVSKMLNLRTRLINRSQVLKPVIMLPQPIIKNHPSQKVAKTVANLLATSAWSISLSLSSWPMKSLCARNASPSTSNQKSNRKQQAVPNCLNNRN